MFCTSRINVAAGITAPDGHGINSLGEAVNNAMMLVEAQSEQLTGIQPKSYTILPGQGIRVCQPKIQHIENTVLPKAFIALGKTAFHSITPPLPSASVPSLQTA